MIDIFGVKIYFVVDNGIKFVMFGFLGGELYCKCVSDLVCVLVKFQIVYNYVCGCIKCWKFEGVIFLQVVVVGCDVVQVLLGESKFEIVNKDVFIQCYCCIGCGVYMYGCIENIEYFFYGLDFVYIEFFDEFGWFEL